MDELSPGAFEHQEHFPSLPSHQNVIIWPQNAIMFCSIFNEASSVRKAHHSANVVTSQVCNQYYSIVSSRSCILHVAKKLLKKSIKFGALPIILATRGSTFTNTLFIWEFYWKCHTWYLSFFYTHTFSGLKILHSKVLKFATKIKIGK